MLNLRSARGNNEAPQMFIRWAFSFRHVSRPSHFASLEFLAVAWTGRIISTPNSTPPPTCKQTGRIILKMILVMLPAVAATAQVSRPATEDSGSGIPSESGVYRQTPSGFSKILGQIVSFKRSGSLLVSKLTVGIKARKENVQLLGPHAQTVVDGRPVFYFVPPEQEADAGVNAGDLVLIRLEVKAERRQFEVGGQGAWRACAVTHGCGARAILTLQTVVVSHP